MPHARKEARSLTTTVEVTAVSDGCRIASWLDGPECAPVLVLSSSLGADHSMWTAQRAALSSRFRVLRYDGRGHGASDAPVGSYSLERLAMDVLEVLDARQLRRVHFCGLSMGGMIGQWLGVHAPERIDHLVLANTSAFMGPAAQWDDRIDRVLREGMSAVADGVIERWFTPRFRQRAKDQVDRVRATLLATSPVGYAGSCAAIRDLDLRASASRIDVPTLLIAGTLDPSTPPERIHEIARAMTAPARVVSLDAAHLSNIEQAEAFNEAVLEFLP